VARNFPIAVLRFNWNWEGPLPPRLFGKVTGGGIFRKGVWEERTTPYFLITTQSQVPWRLRVTMRRSMRT
jgi:hypothetical protein